MPFDEEFRHHLHEVMVAASLEVRDEVEKHKREVVWKAQQTHNSAAMPIAYSKAATYAFRTRTQRVIDCYFQALDDCGIIIDANVEREMLKQIETLTSAQQPLTFPPGLSGPQLAAVQQEHARETMRVGNQLQRDAANRLRAAKMKNARSGAAVTAAPEQPQNPTSDARSVPENKSGQTFISYSWDSDEHRAWVESFATALRQNGVDVVLDRWHLVPGADMYHFMERSVRSAEYVLVICTPAYAAKAEDRVGGVGYEATIITTQLAQRNDQRKFVPILRSGDWTSAVPLWLASRRGLNFSSDTYPASEFQSLLRTLHREEVPAPPLGPRPPFPNQDIPTVAATLPQSTGMSETKRRALGDELTYAERELLDAAANDPVGQINRRRPIGPEILSANGRSFIERGDPRSAAKWLGALEALERKGLIRAASPERHFYAVTQQGYDLAEELGPFVRWSTSEIVLEALYFNHSTEKMTLTCTGVVEVPPIFYPDQYGADGSLTRSLKQHRALLVEDVKPQVLNSLKFEPTDAHFVDDATKETRDFQVLRVTPGDRKTLLLEINE